MRTPAKKIKPKDVFTMEKSSFRNVFSASQSQISLDRTNASMNHPMNANCLRKCAYWELSMHDNTHKLISVNVPKNSGVALRQMNYKMDRTLSPEQVKEKKDKLKIPDGPYPFSTDIIDKMSIYENSMIFNM